MSDTPLPPEIQSVIDVLKSVQVTPKNIDAFQSSDWKLRKVIQDMTQKYTTSDIAVKERLVARNKADAKRATSKQLEHHAELWASETLRIGDIVKVVGSRTSSYRLVMEVKSSTFVGQVIRLSRVIVSSDNRDYDTIGSNTRILPQPTMTETSLSKIREIFRKGLTLQQCGQTAHTGNYTKTEVLQLETWKTYR